jgi:hypothetical protein
LAPYPVFLKVFKLNISMRKNLSAAFVFLTLSAVAKGVSPSLFSSRKLIFRWSMSISVTSLCS